jgi:hypothetical protein
VIDGGNFLDMSARTREATAQSVRTCGRAASSSYGPTKAADLHSARLMAFQELPLKHFARVKDV